MSSLQSAARGRGRVWLRAPSAFAAHCACVIMSLLGAGVGAVQAKNVPPVIWGTPATSVLATKPFFFEPHARDANGDRLRFSVGNRPSWAAFDSSTGRLWGTPARGNSGTYKNITIYVSDGTTRSALQPFTLKVIAVIDRVPTIAGNPPNSVTVGRSYSFQPVARDPYGQRIAFSIRNKPSWLSLDPATGRIGGVPGPTHIGTYRDILLSASDGSASANLPAFSITVSAVGAPAAVGPSSSVTLDWSPPMENTDSSSLTDLAGYRIYYGPKQTSLDQHIELRNPGLTRYVLENLPAGRWYFALTAYNQRGVESDLSGIIATETR